MSSTKRPLFFGLFFVSGFCGLVYQVVWTRMAFASYGIITPVLSVVISVFMLGLALGSWAGGRWIEALATRTRLPAIVFYAAAEFLIGIGAFAVPVLFKAGERMLLSAGQSDSVTYLAFSALLLGLTILPWCIFMGTTFPLMMAYLRQIEKAPRESFSYLYVANVLGAMAGAVSSALILIETFGFHDTLRVAASGNFLIALACLWSVRDQLGSATRTRPALPQPASDIAAPKAREAGPGAGTAPLVPATAADTNPVLLKWVLFLTGFSSMAMEVVWTRAFAPVLKTQVYSFAMIVAAYLAATFLGSLWYRRDLARNSRRPAAVILGALCVAAFLPILLNDARIVRALWYESYPEWKSAVVVLISIMPLCGLLGYLTPGLVDEYSAGVPDRAGTAYAINVLGCILGPLFACYILLPTMSERYALVLLGLPFFAVYLFWPGRVAFNFRFGLGAAAVAVLALSLFVSRTFEDQVIRLAKKAVVRRDYAASVVSFGEGPWKSLLVNGIGMTKLTPITKCMAHLPLAFHPSKPESVLVICFGMGTSYRSGLSWDAKTTAVELVPGVKDAFPYYHDDAEQVLRNPKGEIVIDDGRRFLARTRDSFDVILIDPPPPLNSAGSSLLYSTEFYQAAKRRLKPEGILQAWMFCDPGRLEAALLRPVTEVFPYVRCFTSLEGWGLHVLASNKPLAQFTPAELAARLPPKAQDDLIEWDSKGTVVGYFEKILGSERNPQTILEANPGVKVTDDEPYNEYFLLRHWGVL